MFSVVTVLNLFVSIPHYFIPTFLIRYLEGALVSDGDDPFDSAKEPTGRRRDYIPSTEPGSRLPHMSIRLLSDLTNEATMSTLDLVSAEKVELLLIIAPLEESYPLAQAALKVAASMEVPLKVCVMWPENSANPNGRSEGALQPWKNFIDVSEIRRSDASTSWWDLCQMSETGAILVRPDEHIAWRSKSGNFTDPELKITHVIEAVLRLNKNGI